MTEERKYAILSVATLLCARKVAPYLEGANMLTEHYVWRASEQAKRIADKIDERWPESQTEMARRRESTELNLFLNSNHTNSDCPALAFRVFLPSLFGLRYSFERLRQRSELTADVFEEQPLLDDFGHEVL